MTKEEKLNWIANASNEDVVNSLRWAVLKMSGSTIGIIKTSVKGTQAFSDIMIAFLIPILAFDFAEILAYCLYIYMFS